jgi:hypothetical protein
VSSYLTPNAMVPKKSTERTPEVPGARAALKGSGLAVLVAWGIGAENKIFDGAASLAAMDHDITSKYELSSVIGLVAQHSKFSPSRK